MIEEVDVGCCREDSWRLWNTWIIYALVSGPQLQWCFGFSNSYMQMYSFSSVIAKAAAG